MPHIIRPYCPRDREAVIEQFLALNRYEEPLIHNRRVDRQGAVECLAAALQRVAETDGTALIAELNGQVVGHLFLVFETDASCVKEEERLYAYVSELFVREEARGAGIGRALMADAERRAAGRGHRRLMVGVLSGNTLAESFYRRLGFAAAAVEMTKRVGPSSQEA